MPNELPPRVLYENATIIDGEGGKPYEGTIGVEGTQISFAQPGRVAAWDGAARVDLSGYFATPGFIDCHVHLTCPWDPTMHEPYWKIATPPPSKALTAMANANRSLAAGFTTLRNCGGMTWNAPEDVAVRNAVAERMLIGARIWACAGGVSMTGGHGDRAFPAYLPFDPGVGFGVIPTDGADGCRRAVRERIKFGADFIKIYSTGGVSTPGDGPHSQDFTEEELRAIMDEAHTHDKRVATHAQGLAGIRKAVLAGVDTVEHGSFLDRPTAEEMARRGTMLVTTLRVFSEILKRAANYPNPEAIRKAAMVHDAHRSGLALAKQHGIRIAMGTDASQSIRNGDNALEMEELARSGFTTMEVIQMATKNGALALGLESEIGTIAGGKRADFLVIGKNPLVDMSALVDRGNIRCVVQAGAAKVLRDAAGGEAQSHAFSPEAIARALDA